MPWVVGIVGGGQLARMLALAGLPLGLRFVFLDPAPDACAAGLGKHLRGTYDAFDELDRLARLSDVVTYEFENVPDASIEHLAKRGAVFPDAAALAISRDRITEKTLFTDLGIPTPRYTAVDGPADLERAVAEIGLPAVLKTRTMGYDGKGQAVVRTRADADAWCSEHRWAPMILEELVAFDRELSVIGARGRDGEVRFYPLTENVHRNGILRLSRARDADRYEGRAREYAGSILDHLDYVGVMALELFQVRGGLLANEIAPRVHNSGHWTIEGAETSQFENHLRAILGLPLGSTRSVGCTAMVNLVGNVPEPEAIVAIDGAHLHMYGKKPAPGRKLGHVTVRVATDGELDQALKRLLHVVS